MLDKVCDASGPVVQLFVIFLEGRDPPAQESTPNINRQLCHANGILLTRFQIDLFVVLRLTRYQLRAPAAPSWHKKGAAALRWLARKRKARKDDEGA